MSVSNDWSKHTFGRIIQQFSGFVVVKPADDIVPIPWSCSVCDELYRSSNDENSHLRFGCCERCSLVFAYPNSDLWNAGWRPSKEEVKRDVEQRPKIIVRMM